MTDDRTPTLPTRIASAITSAAGSTPAMLGAFLVVVAWALSGPFLGFSEQWQLIINTTTTITTGLMIFVVQNTQNRDSRAIHTKLDALLEAQDDIDDKLVGIEDLPEKTIKVDQDEIRAAASPG